MFVDHLNKRQQGVLLHYAREVMLADGVVADEEQQYMDVLRRQVCPDVTAEDMSMESLAKLFDRRKSRVSMFLELTGMGYANEDFDPFQSELLQSIASALSLSNGDVMAINSWVRRQLRLVKQANLLMSDS